MEAVGKAVADGEAENRYLRIRHLEFPIAANEVKGGRCALCASVEWRRCRGRHNDANVLAMGAGMIEQDLATKLSISG